MSALPYAQIPAYPDQYSSGNILGRLMDGLGFRYYWATEGLPQEALDYRPAESSRSIKETLDHTLNIVTMIGINFSGDTYVMPEPVGPAFDELRAETLRQIETISDQCKASSDADFADRMARFEFGDNTHTFPFWNTINGTIADAIYHVGQVVAFRRAAGSPIDPGVNVFVGARSEGSKG